MNYSAGSCSMTKHYILNLDPTAKYEWDRCTLRDPITADHPALASLIAAAVGEEPGSYLVAVNIEVKVLEKATPDRTHSATPVEVPNCAPLPQIAELVA
jgi:hypothetical protein